MTFRPSASNWRSWSADACCRLASAAVPRSASRPSRADATLSDRRSTSRPPVQTRTTDISPDVSVLVLSVQTTVVEPSVSTAGSLRTSACRLAMRRIPTASAIVATAGSASGTAATASAMPVSTTRPNGAPWIAPNVATTAATTRVSQTRRWPSASSRRSSGVRSSGIDPTSVPMRPTSVAAPVATTTARPVPTATVVPL